MQWRVGQCHIDIHIRVVIVNISVGTYSSYNPPLSTFLLCFVWCLGCGKTCRGDFSVLDRPLGVITDFVAGC